MVLSNRSRCMILIMFRNFDYLLRTLRLICGVSGRESDSQEVSTWSNPDLMEGKMFRGEGGNGLTFRTSLVFLFELLISTLLSGGNGLVSFFSFFFIASAPVFFFCWVEEHDPYSIMIEFTVGSIAWTDHSIWIGLLWRFWVCFEGNCLATVDINTRDR